MDYLITEADHSARLDVFAGGLNIGLSRAQAQKLIDEKQILVNGNPAKSSYRIKTGDKVTIEIPPPKEYTALSEKIPLDVIFEDRDIIVINKPRGMVVHPAAGNYSGTLVNALLSHCKDLSGIGGVLRPGIVHRLDKDTSGVIVAAKNDAAHRSLSRQFKEHAVKKIYLALVNGRVKNDAGIIRERIGRHPVQRQKMTVIKLPQEGARLKSREATTHYKVVKRLEGYTLVELKPETGRTHQIRVHMTHLGHPILGDAVYGRGGGGQLLHAKSIGFKHPSSGEYVEFEAPMPLDMERILKEDERSQEPKQGRS